jgi:hypothetical protein
VSDGEKSSLLTLAPGNGVGNDVHLKCQQSLRVSKLSTDIGIQLIVFKTFHTDWTLSAFSTHN